MTFTANIWPGGPDRGLRCKQLGSGLQGQELLRLPLIIVIAFHRGAVAAFPDVALHAHLQRRDQILQLGLAQQWCHHILAHPVAGRRPGRTLINVVYDIHVVHVIQSGSSIGGGGGASGRGGASGSREGAKGGAVDSTCSSSSGI
jgi:uncharacterized membrane protein YgcG